MLANSELDELGEPSDINDLHTHLNDEFCKTFCTNMANKDKFVDSDELGIRLFGVADGSRSIAKK
jgi:hypothetical protein